MLDQKQIEAKIAALKAGKEQYIEQAKATVNQIEGQIKAWQDMLQSVLAEPKESNVSEFKKPEVANVEV